MHTVRIMNAIHLHEITVRNLPQTPVTHSLSAPQDFSRWLQAREPLTQVDVCCPYLHALPGLYCCEPMVLAEVQGTVKQSLLSLLLSIAEYH